MYWQDHFKTPAQAVVALKAAAAGKIRLTPQMAHIAHIAARSGLNGISEDPANLGQVPYRLTPDSDFLGGKRGLGFGYDDGLRGMSYDQDRLRGLPELDFARMGLLDFARMNDLTPSQLGSLSSFLKKVVKTATKLSPSHYVAKALKIDKFSPSQILASKLSASSKSSPKMVPVAMAPATEVLPGAPAQPIPQLPEPVATSPMSFSQGGGSGGSSSGFSPAPVPGETAPAEEGLSLPVMIGVGVAGLAVLYFVMKKKR